jgi:hypothetical protein
MNRSDEQLFDPRIADWLEGDPTTAPDQALDIVLAAFPSIRQRHTWRVPRRFTAMSYPFRLGLTAAAAIVVAATGLYLLGPSNGPGVGRASPSPSPQPTVVPSSAAAGTPVPTAALTHFVSPKYGYSVDVPSAFHAIPASAAWPQNEPVGPEQNWVDRFLTSTTFVGIASQALPQATDAQAWLDGYAQSVAKRECGAAATAWTAATVAGHPARSVSLECDGSRGLEVALVVDGRGWVISGERAVVEQMLPTFELP